jgi:hypothetical protein
VPYDEEVCSPINRQKPPRPLSNPGPQLSPGARSSPSLGSGYAAGRDAVRRDEPPAYRGSLRPGRSTVTGG